MTTIATSTSTPEEMVNGLVFPAAGREIRSFSFEKTSTIGILICVLQWKSLEYGLNFKFVF